MNRWMSNSLPNLFNKSATPSGTPQKAGAGNSSFGRNATLKLDVQHARLFEYWSNIETNYAALFSQIDTYHFENARLRDCGDQLSMLVAQLGKLTVGCSGKKQLEDVAKQMAVVEDYRNAEVQRIKSKVLDPLSTYGKRFKKLRSEMRLLAKATSRELRAKEKLDRLQLTGMAGNATKVEAGKRAMQEAAYDVASRRRAIDATIADFERTRITDLQIWLREFMQIEMLFHAKVLSAYNSAWQSVRAMRTDDDLAEFRKTYLEIDVAAIGQQLVDASASLAGTSQRSATDATRTVDYSDEETEYDDPDDEDDDENEEDETTASASRQTSSYIGTATPLAFVKRTIA